MLFNYGSGNDAQNMKDFLGSKGDLSFLDFPAK